jgi:hypothetical protein
MVVRCKTVVMFGHSIWNHYDNRIHMVKDQNMQPKVPSPPLTHMAYFYRQRWNLVKLFNQIIETQQCNILSYTFSKTIPFACDAPPKGLAFHRVPR